MIRLLRALSGLTTMICAAGTLHAQIVPAPTCGPAIAAFEHTSGLPPQVLNAIGIVESGRLNPRTGISAPWPWTINVAGAGHAFDSAADAIAAVKAAQAAGVQSIDVGCMQINLLHHPHAFATLQDAFDPVGNVRYAAAFLVRLHEQTGSWGAAIAAYHSATPALGPPYARTVALIWPSSSRYGLVAPDAAASTRAALATEIDPDDVLTPEFRAQLVDADMQRGRVVPARIGATANAAVHSTPAWPAGAPSSSAVSARERDQPSAGDRGAFEDEIDPQRVLTPTFRAEMVTAARARHRSPASGVGEDARIARPRGAAVVRRTGQFLPRDAVSTDKHGARIPTNP